MMQPLPVRQTDRMHTGRISIIGERYFVTLVMERRQPWLAGSEAKSMLLEVLRRWPEEGQGEVLAATVMPDHVHVLFQLGIKLTLGQTIARWKGEARKSVGYTGAFQRDFWEHRLRESEAVEDYALSVFLNPYRAGLLRAEGIWPGWWASRPSMFQFTAILSGNGAPPNEWIDWSAARFAGLAHGE